MGHWGFGKTHGMEPNAVVQSTGAHRQRRLLSETPFVKAPNYCSKTPSSE
jgi:hypothetical protein